MLHSAFHFVFLFILKLGASLDSTNKEILNGVSSSILKLLNLFFFFFSQFKWMRR